MSISIKIDIISDVVCPWCIIGYNRLSRAISELNIEDKVKVEWHPFQLNPDMPEEGEEVIHHMAKKYGMTLQDSRQSLAQMASLGAEVGFSFDFFDGFKMVNTADLHVLLDFAKESGKQTELKLRLFTACFTENKDVSDRKILAKELEIVGLNPEKGFEYLDNQEIRNRVLAHEMRWKQAGVAGVPTMIFNDSNPFTGAQPISIYKQVLSSCLGEEPLKEPLPLASVA